MEIPRHGPMVVASQGASLRKKKLQDIAAPGEFGDTGNISSIPRFMLSPPTRIADRQSKVNCQSYLIIAAGTA